MTLYAGHGNPQMRMLRNENERLRNEAERLRAREVELVAALEQADAAIEIVRKQVAHEAGVDLTVEQIVQVLNDAITQVRAALANRRSADMSDITEWNAAIDTAAKIADEYDHRGDPGAAMYAAPRIRDRILRLRRAALAKVEGT